MELLRLADVHLTYPPRFRSHQRPEADDGADTDEVVTADAALSTPTPALRGVSLTVSAGEAVGILGSAGSGRTTVLALAAGVLRPDSGTVQIRGYATGLTAAGAGAFGDLPVRANIERSLVLMGTRQRRARERVPEVAGLAGLADELDTPLRSLSRQQARLLGYATALHAEPTVFLADENLAQGAQAMRAAAQQRLKDYADDAHAVLLVTNRPTVLRDVCTRAVVLDAGRLVFDGSVDDALLTLRGGPPRAAEPHAAPPRLDDERPPTPTT